MAGAPRIDWSHDGRAVLTCLGGTLRRHAVTSGEVDPNGTIVDGPHVLDARWRGDGSIVAVDASAVARRYREDGDVVAMPREHQLVLTAAWIADADVYLALAPATMFVANLADGVERWKLDGHKHNAGGLEERTGGAIASDGKTVAIGYATRAYAHYSYERKEGRGWLVIHTGKDQVLDRSWTAVGRATRSWAHASEPARFAFDRSGRRFALASIEPVATIGAIRLGKDEKYAREHAGGARAVALDDKGILAAYAYPKAIEAAPRRLRVDYLEPGVKGGSKIAVVDTLWIDPDLDDIVALAFDRTSRRIACLDARGRIDVVPVP